MQSVIGQYATEDQATQAVRALERDHHISIQDVVIADRGRRAWRRFKPTEGRSFGEEAKFLVVMRGEPTEVARAHALLS